MSEQYEEVKDIGEVKRAKCGHLMFPETFEDEAQILKCARISLKWLRRAIQSDSLKYKPEVKASCL